MLRVLIVDDEESIRSLLARWLGAWGYETRQASSAVDALEQMAAAPSEIVLCDVMMPIHDGLWLTDRIREGWPSVAVIMASGAQDLATVTSTKKKGAVGFVPKPFDREVLRQALRRAEGLLQ